MSRPGDNTHIMLDGTTVLYYAYWDYRKWPPELVVPEDVSRDIEARSHEIIRVDLPIDSL